MTIANRISEVKHDLEAFGHTVLVPIEIEEFDYLAASTEERAELKRQHDLIREHWRKIEQSDAILVLNENAKGIPNYIGGNSFLEMGFAHVLGISIFLMNPIPNMTYDSEMAAMDPIVINGELSLICSNHKMRDTSAAETA